MSVVIVNWGNGENDPFTYFSARMKAIFEEMGQPARIISVNDRFFHELAAANEKGLDFALTWQGLGSKLGFAGDHDTPIWDHLKIPLICYHGDHPCHMPSNHKATSPWIRHVYASGSFAAFANVYIPRKVGARFYQSLAMFADGVKGRFEGDYFVFPKNLDDLDTTLGEWRHVSQRRASAFLLEAADAIIGEFRSGNARNHHAIVESMLTADVLEMLYEEFDNRSELAVRMHIHSLLDKIHRNAVSEHIVKELRDVPLRIYGRGWERFKRMRNPRHEFLTFGAISDNAFQFASNYGILDAPPIHDILHDRTLRAIRNKAGFLAGVNWPCETMLGRSYDELFFDGRAGALRERAERVMQSPRAHRELCCDFGQRYNQTFSPFDFVKYLESQGDAVRAQAA